VVDDPEQQSIMQRRQVESATSAAISVKEFAFAIMGQKLSDDETEGAPSALGSGERQEWIKAIREEFNNMISRGEFRLTEEKEQPAGKTAFPISMIFKRKRSQLGEVIKYKSLDVLDGSKMKMNMDFNESNAGLLVAVAHANGWGIQFCDIVLVFTLAQSQNTTHGRLPNLKGVVPGYHRGQIADVVWKFYDDKTVLRSWFHTSKPVLLQMGFLELGGHLCVMIRRDEPMEPKGIFRVIMLTNFVDDIIMAANQNDLFQWFENEVVKHFGYTNAGEIVHCLRKDFLRAADGRFLSLLQHKCAKEEVKSLGFNKEKGSKTPMEPKVKLSLANSPDLVERNNRFKKESLQYLAVLIRPDLSYSIAILFQFLHASGQKHMAAADRVLQNLKDTMELSTTNVSIAKDLNVLCPGPNTLVAYSDPDFAAWKEGKQTNVGLSTSAAETTAIMKISTTSEQHVDIFTKPVLGPAFRSYQDFTHQIEINQLMKQRKNSVRRFFAKGG
jgi:hypothetical protein